MRLLLILIITTWQATAKQKVELDFDPETLHGYAKDFNLCNPQGAEVRQKTYNKIL